MSVIKVYDSDFVGEQILDKFKKFFRYKVVQGGVLEDKTTRPNDRSWNLKTFNESIGQQSNTNPLTGLKYTTKQVSVSFTRGQSTQSSFSDFIQQNITSGQKFNYHFSDIVLPDFDDDFLTFSSVNADNYAHYNYKLEDYEDKATASPEVSLPNFMGAVYRDRTAPLFPLFGQEARDYYNYFGSVDMDDHYLISEYEDINHFAFDDQTYDYSFNSSSLDENYFYKFSQINDLDTTEYSNVNKNIFIAFNYTNQDTKKTLNCPYFVKFKMNLVTTFEQDSNGVYQPRNFFRRNSGLNLMENVSLLSFKDAPKVNRSFFVDTLDSLVQTNIQIYDYFQYIRGFVFENFDVNRQENIFMRKPLQRYAAQSEDEDIVNDAFLVNHINDVREFLYNQALSVRAKDILQNNFKCYSQIIGYKIEKYDVGLTPLQTFYIFNEEKTIVDTQLKLDKQYRYVIKAMVAIGGFSYSYTNVETEESFNPLPLQLEETATVNFRFVVEPSLKIAEVVVKEFNTIVVEPPPLAPMVEFSIEKDKRNLIKISIENTKGNYIGKLIEDKKIDKINNIDEIYMSNLQTMHGPHYPYSSRAWGGIFQIFRIMNKPISFSDFNGNVLATMTTEVYGDGQNYNRVMYSDYIRHNEDYYYLFRSLTHRGNPGLTSQVFKVRLIEDADEMILDLSTISLEPTELITFENRMRRFLQIIPNPAQCAISEKNLDFTLPADNVNNINGLRLGHDALNDSLWDYDTKRKHFKIRLESKDTGKKIDLNVLFNFLKPS